MAEHASSARCATNTTESVRGTAVEPSGSAAVLVLPADAEMPCAGFEGVSGVVAVRRAGRTRERLVGGYSGKGVHLVCIPVRPVGV